MLALDACYAALDPTEMQNRLTAGSPILGEFCWNPHTRWAYLWDLIGTFNDTGSELSNWLGTLSDDTPIESINIPGTHDSAACMFSFAFVYANIIHIYSTTQGIIRVYFLNLSTRRSAFNISL